MGVCDEQVVDEVLVLDLGRRAAPSAALLRLVDVDRLRLGITPVRQRHDDLLLGDQVLVTEVGMIVDDFGAALVTKSVAHLGQFVPDDLEEQFRIRQNIRKSFNFF